MRTIRILLLVLVSIGCTYSVAATKHPIVLVHGFMGFDNIGPIDYFNGVPYALSRKGNQVYVSQVSALNSSEVRGEQLLWEVKRILALSGASKVNLIGHSHGAPTARYVASVAPELVASVTSVAGVNYGSPVADAVRNALASDSPQEYVVARAVESFAKLLNGLSVGGKLEQNALNALGSLTTDGALAFNAKYPEGLPSSYCGNASNPAENGVYYYSWGGTKVMTNYFDPSDYALFTTNLLIDSANDGLVSRCSMHLGEVINDSYRMNHLDVINQVMGLHALFTTDPLAVYQAHARRLERAGL